MSPSCVPVLKTWKDVNETAPFESEHGVQTQMINPVVTGAAPRKTYSECSAGWDCSVSRSQNPIRHGWGCHMTPCAHFTETKLLILGTSILGS